MTDEVGMGPLEGTPTPTDLTSLPALSIRPPQGRSGPRRTLRDLPDPQACMRLRAGTETARVKQGR
jgi:hypothetical protein